MNLSEVLKEKYLYTGDDIRSKKMILFIGFFVFVFILFFKSSLEGEGIGIERRIITSFTFGISVIVIAFFNISILNILISPKKKESWLILDEFLFYMLQFLTIALGNIFLNSYFFKNDLSVIDIGISVFYTLVIGGLAISVFLVKESRGKGINQNRIKQIPSETNVPPILDINGSCINVSQVLFFESKRNYIHIKYVDGSIDKFRFTIKELEENLRLFPEFIRCHKSFIINTTRIKKVKWLNQGLKILLKDSNDLIPVSRSHSSKFK